MKMKEILNLGGLTKYEKSCILRLEKTSMVEVGLRTKRGQFSCLHLQTVVIDYD